MRREGAGKLVGPVIAGLILARCRCCSEPQNLEAHDDLDEARRLCPATLRIHLDRGDGLFEDTGVVFSGTRPDGGAAARSAEPDVLSDRPQRSDEKVRISLERATFAGAARRR